MVESKTCFGGVCTIFNIELPKPRLFKDTVVTEGVLRSILSSFAGLEKSVSILGAKIGAKRTSDFAKIDKTISGLEAAQTKFLNALNFIPKTIIQVFGNIGPTPLVLGRGGINDFARVFLVKRFLRGQAQSAVLKQQAPFFLPNIAQNLTIARALRDTV